MSTARAVPRPTPRSIPPAPSSSNLAPSFPPARPASGGSAPPPPIKSDTRALAPPRLPPPRPPSLRPPPLPAPPLLPRAAPPFQQLVTTDDGPTRVITAAPIPAPRACPEWDRELIPPPAPIAVGLAPAPAVANDKEERDEAEVAAFAAAQPAAKARAAARRAVTYARATCIFVGFAVLIWLKWLRASVPLAASHARERLAVEWTRAKERAGL